MTSQWYIPIVDKKEMRKETKLKSMHVGSVKRQGVCHFGSCCVAVVVLLFDI